MDCPRCTRQLGYRSFETEGGYRSNVTMRELHECSSCRLAVVSGANVRDDESGPAMPLRRTLLVRSSRSSKWPCPACAIPLSALTLSWAGDALGIESCDRCDVIVVDRGELDRIEVMLDESAALQGADVDRVLASVPADDEGTRLLERPLRRFLRAIHLLPP